jgi:hypothetical protein
MTRRSALAEMALEARQKRMIKYLNFIGGGRLIDVWKSK